jgi:HD-GYP domain-containing protein (c-di-GMP phosphodiesterase class II)
MQTAYKLKNHVQIEDTTEGYLTPSTLEQKPNHGYVTDTPEAGTMLGLLCEVGKKIGSVTNLNKLVKQITQMTQSTLNATASSVLLFDDKEQELYFEVAEGESEKALRKIKLNAGSGIAGWVAQNKKPIIINDVMKDQRFDPSIDEITGFTTMSIICAPLLLQRKLIGVIEVLNKSDGSDFNGRDLETLTSVASTAAMAIENAQLHQTVLNAYKSTIKALAAAIDAKDHYTCGHSQRVMEYALLGAEPLSLLRDELDVLEYAGILHDIGKIGIADSILSKDGQLTDREWEIIRQHPLIGADMLKDIPFLEKARVLILHHHERYDGGGYPGGVSGEDIPLGARLIAIADAFDTMTTDRAYRAAFSVDRAIKELVKYAGTQFCPMALEAFISGYNNQQKRPGAGNRNCDLSEKD